MCSVFKKKKKKNNHTQTYKCTYGTLVIDKVILINPQIKTSCFCKIPLQKILSILLLRAMSGRKEVSSQIRRFLSGQ